MDEDISIINSTTRNEKIKNFFVKNKKTLLLSVLVIVLLLLTYFGFKEYKENKKILISDQYNTTIIEFSSNSKETTKNALVDLVFEKDSTYSPLSLYFIIDNKLISDHLRINELFDVIIQDTKLDKEIKNLVIYKKGLFNADKVTENELLDILKPIINSDSVWKAHSLYLVAEYFYSKNQKQKSKEFFNQIITLEKANEDLKLEAQKRLSRDLSE
jgi:predicted negative regulator of RcsB-dependent stress response